jgi:hypothetical protein
LFVIVVVVVVVEDKTLRGERKKKSRGETKKP